MVFLLPFQLSFIKRLLKKYLAHLCCKKATKTYVSQNCTKTASRFVSHLAYFFSIGKYFATLKQLHLRPLLVFNPLTL
jgi:hypothetical protein